MSPRRSALAASTILLLSGLATVTATAAETSASAPLPPPISEERWCSTHAAPCFVSVDINGSPLTPADGLHPEVQAPFFDGGDYKQTDFALLGDTSTLATTDDITVVIDTGRHFIPDKIQYGHFVMEDVDTSETPAGRHRITITGNPVEYATGCDSGDWPPVCPTNADEDQVIFDGTLTWAIEDREFGDTGVYDATNANYNGIFFSQGADGTGHFTSDIWSPHFKADGTTERVGFARFRVSYEAMRSAMDIPNPATLLPGSFTGTINGTARPGAFTIWHDPDGGGMFIEASGFTFSKKRLRVAATRITPTRPTLIRAARVAPRRGLLVHSGSAPRGAKVTGYVAQCESSRAGQGVEVAVIGDVRRIRLRGLGPRAYECKVRATSRAGNGPWSAVKRIPRG